MGYGVSFTVAPGVRIYRSGRGGVAIALFLGFLYAYLWLFVAAIYAAVLIALTVGFIAFLVVRFIVTKTRVSDLQAHAVEPATVKLVGRLTEPPTWGVYRVALPSNGKRTSEYRLGNHPVRQHELVREFGAAELIMLFKSRAEAEELKSLLASGRINPVSPPNAG